MPVSLRLVLAALLLAQLPSSALLRAAEPGIDADLRAEAIIGIDFSAAEIDTMLPDLVDQLESFLALRALALPNAVPPALVFNPLPVGWSVPVVGPAPRWSELPAVERPADLEQLAFASVGQLAALLKGGRVTSTELTRLAIARLKRHDPRLHCVITLLEERALAAAARADAELAAGGWRGPLHGVPFGVKDLCAVAGTRSSWGAAPYRDQVIEDTATVVARLEAAGAILVAKLSLGALAWGDVWFGGTTRNPWRPEQGASGSSAGPAAAVSAGLLPFAIGTETWGSIVSPCTRCGVTGLRPTFGRVSRAGTMALSWSMDKIGPIARRVEDCAMVLDVIRGSDPRDPSVLDAAFPYRPEPDLASLRIGYLAEDFAADYTGRELDAASLERLRELGATLIPVTLPDFPVGDLAFLLSVEAAAAFDELTLSGRDDELTRQVRFAWPNVFRAARLIPAVEYLQANRARWRLIQAMGAMMADLDLYVAPAFEGDNLLLTNLTGHPCVVLPNGFTEPDQAHSITLVGGLFGEAELLALARVLQEATPHHLPTPPNFSPGAR